MVFKGKKSKVVIETELFSVTNMLVKRDFHTDSELKALIIKLKGLCREYLEA